MKQFLFLLVILFTSIVSFSQRNVVLIIADDLSSDYFGFYENHQDTIAVPNIRSLLNKGVRFKNATANPVCSATRSGILTGRYSFRTGVGGIIGGIGGSGTLDTAEITIPKIVKALKPSIGRAHIGKWHLNAPAPTGNLQFPNKMGYDHFEGPFIGQLPSYTNWTKYTNGASSTVTNYATSENVNNAFSWIKTHSSSPFFCWLAFNAPHEPLHTPPANLHTITGLTGTNGDINNNPKKYFKAMIQAMDTELGRLFDSLKTINKFDSTDFIFIGDNGNTPRTAQITDTSRAKGTVYQYGIRVPMIVSGPSVSNPGRVSEALVNTVDLFATSLELLGITNWQALIPGNKPVDSKSMLPIIKNTATEIRPWSFSEIFKLTTDSDDGKAIQNSQYKLIDFDGTSQPQEFYDISSDPLEQNNLLNRTLTQTESNNYFYLCNQMGNLTGSGNYCNTALPVKFLNFYGNDFLNKIQLNWSVSASTNNISFDIERSNDGNIFQKIGIVNSGPNSAAINNYFFQDFNCIKGNNYYRIKQHDLDGRTTTSSIIKIAYGKSNTQIIVFPNPAKEKIQINLNGTRGATYQIMLQTAEGRIVYQQKHFIFSEGIMISTTNIPSGVYFLKFSGASEQKTIKVIIQK